MLYHSTSDVHDGSLSLLVRVEGDPNVTPVNPRTDRVLCNYDSILPEPEVNRWVVDIVKVTVHDLPTPSEDLAARR